MQGHTIFNVNVPAYITKRKARTMPETIAAVEIKVQLTNLVPTAIADGSSNDAIAEWCETNDVLCVVLPARSGKFSDGTYREAAFAQPEFFIPGFKVIDGYTAVQNAYADAGIDTYNSIQTKIFDAMDVVDQAKTVGDRQAERDANDELKALRDDLKPYVKPLTTARDNTTKAVGDALKVAMDVTPRGLEEVAELHRQYLIDVCGGTEDTAKFSMVDAAIRQNETDHKNLVRRKISRVVRSSKSQQKDALTTRLLKLSDDMMLAAGEGEMEKVQLLSAEMSEVKDQLMNLG